MTHVNNHKIYKSTSHFFKGSILVDKVDTLIFQLKIKENFFWGTEKDLSSNTLFKQAKDRGIQLTLMIC